MKTATFNLVKNNHRQDVEKIKINSRDKIYIESLVIPQTIMPQWDEYDCIMIIVKQFENYQHFNNIAATFILEKYEINPLNDLVIYHPNIMEKYTIFADPCNTIYYLSIDIAWVDIVGDIHQFEFNDDEPIKLKLCFKPN